MGKFSIDLNSALKKVGKSMPRVIGNVAIAVTDATQDLTPFGKPELWSVGNQIEFGVGYVPGNLKANWQVGIGTPNLSTSSPKDITGNASKQRVRKAVRGSAFNGTQPIYYTNDVDYAYAVEFGHSRVQAPQGMLRKAVSRFATTVAVEAKKEMART